MWRQKERSRTPQECSADGARRQILHLSGPRHNGSNGPSNMSLRFRTQASETSLQQAELPSQ
ncbi:unnamed protein product [Protopolystoma xenopodis]|uniref:Uncharacterized protein n=1 Tax=Protopolystoma xenopodis TaxID=117903 RepID=A0A448WGT6_9PLAT|nr:unnamed protein product [Protopolystoma xenopodis]